jgi:Collagen triple helix repeat (20 copies)
MDGKDLVVRSNLIWRDVMFSRVRKRITYGNVVLSLILIFAMSGGAYAAGKYLITSTKQISPKVLKALKGIAGPRGLQGTPGAAGPVGKEGPPGKEGPVGKEGPAGKEGPVGKEGPAGEKGQEGTPWTAGGTLPTGSTETGTWVIHDTASGPEETQGTAVSFPIRLASHPQVTTFIKVGDPVPPECTGDATNPGAQSGHFCVFEAQTPVYKGNLKFAAATNPAGNFNAGTTGAELVFLTSETVKAGEEVSAEGSWAVTG